MPSASSIGGGPASTCGLPQRVFVMKDVPSVQLSRLSLLAMKISPAPEMRKCGGASRISIAPLL